MSSLELGTCGGQDCILKCTCGTGWSDTGSGAYIKRTSKNAYAFTGGASSRAASSTPQHKTCYKSVSCSDYFSGYTSGANVSSGHYGYTATQTTNGDTLYCHKDVGTCTYSCPSDYYTSATDGYKLTSTSKNKELVKSSTYSYNCSATNTIKCYTQIAKTCADYGLKSAEPDGQTCTAVTKKLGSSNGTCYTDCKSKCDNSKGYYATKAEVQNLAHYKAGYMSGINNSDGCYSGIYKSCSQYFDADYRESPAFCDSDKKAEYKYLPWNDKSCYTCVQEGCPNGYFETDKSGTDCDYSTFRTTIQDKFGYEWSPDICKYNCTKDTNGCYNCEQKYFITKSQCFDSSSLIQWGYSSSYRGLELWVRTNTGGGMANWSWTWSCDTTGCTSTTDDRADPCCSGTVQTFSQSDTFGDMTTRPLVIPVSKFAKECSANINSVDGEWWKY